MVKILEKSFVFHNGKDSLSFSFDNRKGSWLDNVKILEEVLLLIMVNIPEVLLWIM